MNERWVCKRCFADNDEASATCVQCGLIRGAESTEADRAGWAAAEPAQPVQPAAWQRLLRFWWIPVLGIVLAVGWFTTARRGDDGALTGAGTLGVTEMRVGDCFNAAEFDTAEETEISDVDGVPCTDPHDFEVYVVQDHEAASYPSPAEFDSIFEELCISAFEGYVGAPYASSVIYASMISPTEEGWDAGDRGFICYLFEPLDDSLRGTIEQTASLRGAAR